MARFGSEDIERPHALGHPQIDAHDRHGDDGESSCQRNVPGCPLERVPANYIEASADLGAEPRQTFWTVILPLALPGIIAGSIFTFSLTLGDYIVPTIVGNSRLFIGMAVYTLQGTAGNVPLAAAFTVVPMAIMGVYLWMAKRMGAFDVL